MRFSPFFFVIRPRGQATTISRSTETNVATSPMSNKQHRIHERLTPHRRAHHTPTSPTPKASYPEAASPRVWDIYDAKTVYFYLPYTITHKHITARKQHIHTFSRYSQGRRRSPSYTPSLSTIHLTEPLLRSWIARSTLPPPYHQLQVKWLQNNHFADSASYLFSSSPLP